MPEKVLMIAGLGEPGPEFGRQRRNIGFAVLDALADYFSLVEAAEKPGDKYEFGRVQANNESGEPLQVLLVKPMTAPGSAGAPLAGAAGEFGISPDRILLAHDESDLVFGDARLKRGGPGGGHRGVRDVIQALGTPDFHRLRIGIGKSADGDAQAHSQGMFNREERGALSDYVDDCVQRCQEWLFRI